MENNKELKIFLEDPYLNDFKDDIYLRINRYEEKKAQLLNRKRKLKSVANFHEYYGFHRNRQGFVYREWAPNADEVFLSGDFNNWKLLPLTRNENGDFEVQIIGQKTLPHNSRIKTVIRKDGMDSYKVPMFIHKVRQELNDNGIYDFYGIIENTRGKYKFKNKFKICANFNPYIYETHIGIAQEKEDIGTYEEFLDILPRIKDLGYNAIQIMAIASHAYYGSFGYHVTNFFAASHWFGDTDNLKKLIDKAHELGLAVLMDIVHSHAATNVNEGVNNYDGTDYQLFHSGARGHHSAWDSKVFDYNKNDVLKFLLSNLNYWLTEYHFDGFRFDGVTSMLYLDHGIGKAFTSYNDYFSMNTDIDACVYLTLANELIKEINPNAITIAEDVSGMPGLAIPIEDGGMGFDYRFNMGVPDFWAKQLDLDDHDWNMNWMWHELTTKRPDEKTISYAESHDQALVGDKTIMFKLADSEIYWNMQLDNQSYIIHRAIALHKLITSVTMNLASNGYLNFMGNEFGHPEWIDFPSERNNWSFHYARRQWHLVDDENLKYKWLNQFNKESVHFSKDKGLLNDYPMLMMLHNEFKLLEFKRRDLYFVYNFHPTRSYESLSLPIDEAGHYKVVFDSDQSRFGGLDRISNEYIYEAKQIYGTDHPYNISIYLPSRTMLVLERVKE